MFSRGHHGGLVGHRLAYRGDVAAGTQIVVEVRRIAPVALGSQPCPRSQRGIAIGDENVEFCARIAVIEPDQELALFDPGAVAHGKLAHHAAIGMLHALPPAFDLEIAGGDRRARNRCERAPHRHRGRERGDHAGP